MTGQIAGSAESLSNMRVDRWLISLGCLLTFSFAAAHPANAGETEIDAVDRLQATKIVPATGVNNFVRQHCVACHDSTEEVAGLDLDAALTSEVGLHRKTWEHVVRKLRGRRMPPADLPRPTEDAYDSVISVLETQLDRAAAERPDPGRTPTFRRLNRSEYQNAIRDLLSVDVDISELLPADESGHGFDNVALSDLSPTLIERYLRAATEISRLAVGNPGGTAGSRVVRLPADRTQEEHVEGLPLGTRGGLAIRHTFPLDGQYMVSVRLARDRNEHVEGLNGPHQLEILLDRRAVASLKVQPPADRDDHETVDANLQATFEVTAGPHDLGVTFLKTTSALLETKRQPYQAHFNMHRHPRLSPAIYEVSITGPHAAARRGHAPSCKRLFVCQPAHTADEENCARRILTTVLRRAFRRAVDQDDLDGPMQFYRDARAGADFADGIEMALSAILVSPQFLFRIEHDPADVPPGTAYRVSDVELASRLSFFLWSSIPDDELLDTAIRGTLHEPAVLTAQVRRMVADERADALITNFARQWLQLRSLQAWTPDLRLFPDFDDNLRAAFRRESELCFENVLRTDGSVLELLQANHTYLNERLARHYGIPHVYGSRFRRVSLGQDGRRGGLLRQGSILTTTSYATRTSPVLRGKWVLENILGMPPAPPPAGVPALKDNTVAATLSVRQRLAAHRADPACATCHDLIDPLGFALENFDAVGRWRDVEEGQPIDVTGGLPDGRHITGVAELEQAILSRPELFVSTFAEKLLTFALGRGIEYYDAAAVRQIVRESRANDYRLSSLIEGITRSVPFQMRRSE